jgi:Mitochondrial genome maintenance MGM101
MASSPRAFIRAITQSSGARSNRARCCSSSTQQSNSFSRTPEAYKTSRPAHSFTPRRSIFLSSHLRQAQPAAAPRPNSAPNPPSATLTKPAAPSQPGSADLKAGLSDHPNPQKPSDESSPQIDWTTSFHGLSDSPFSKEATNVLLKPIDPHDVEIKPDGIIYLPEIKYRRILNQAFGPGGWGLAPRGESMVTAKAVTREYALLAHGRSVRFCFPLASIWTTTLTLRVGWCPSRGVNKTTSPLRALLPLQKAANPMH